MARLRQLVVFVCKGCTPRIELYWLPPRLLSFMIDEQFRVFRGMLVTVVLLLGFVAGILLSLAWQWL
jgi:hypothetical protein